MMRLVSSTSTSIELVPQKRPLLRAYPSRTGCCSERAICCLPHSPSSFFHIHQTNEICHRRSHRPLTPSPIPCSHSHYASIPLNRPKHEAGCNFTRIADKYALLAVTIAYHPHKALGAQCGGRKGRAGECARQVLEDCNSATSSCTVRTHLLSPRLRIRLLPEPRAACCCCRLIPI